jgi:hypothetical protein
MNSVESRPGFLARHPWIFVVLAFVLLLGAWSTLITIAVKHAPEKIVISDQ